MLQKFKYHLESEFPFLKDKNLLIAISGGLDSVVLFHLLNNLKYNISLAHCNFQLRGKESDIDEQFVINLSKKYSCEIYSKKFNTNEYVINNNTSTQIAARELRYHWFQKLTKENNIDFILTAHHLDDNLETFIINLTRGSGLDGFTGIPKVNENIIRPFLIFSRKEIHQYAIENNIQWREDKSNSSNKYIRNKIRHKVIPTLKEINPSLLNSFSKSIDILKESQQIIKDKVDELSKKYIKKEKNLIKLDIEKIKKLSNPKAYLYQFLKDFKFTEWNDVNNLLDAQSGKQVHSISHSLLKDRDFLVLSEKKNLISNNKEFLIDKNTFRIEYPLVLTFERLKEKETKTKNTIYIDSKYLESSLKIKKWEIGDYIYPIGMKGKKKVSKFFKDEKFSLLDKKNTWLLCNSENKIIWIIGHRQDRRFVGNQKIKITLHS